MIREENVFGLPVTVGTPDELREMVGDEHAVHMVIRCVDAVGDKPYPALAARRRRTPREDCGEICWYDPKSIVDPRATMLCMQCTVARSRREGWAGMTALAPRKMVDEAKREIR